MRRSTSRNIWVWSCLVISLAAAVVACGPDFPIRLLDDPDGSVLTATAADFHVEIHRLIPAGKPSFQSSPPPHEQSVYEQSAAADAADLDADLAAAGTSADRRATIVSQYRALRAKLADFTKAYSDERERFAPRPATRPALAALPDPPAGIPEEFSDYIHGLIAFDKGDYAAARADWQSLLALPPDQRRYKSVWAAFMLGKSFLDEDPAKSLPWFAAARKFAADGFTDSLGLAASSLGWEAQADFKSNRFADAIHLYLAQEATGDPTVSNSLRDVAGDIVTHYPAELAALAKDAACRDVITAYFTSRGNRYAEWNAGKRTMLTLNWLNTIESAGVADLAGADRLAWAAYQDGDMPQAARWLQRAPADSAVAHWIRAKLLIREGRVPQAAAELDKAVSAFPANEEWPGSLNTEREYDDVKIALHPRRRAQGELAILDLSRHQYADSLNLFLAGGYWRDAAYVAEHVLTPDELLDFIHNRGADICTDAFGEAHSLHYLAARRLVRLNRFAEALPLFPADSRKLFEEYSADLKSAQKGPAPQRAQFLWSAAQLARYHGMEIMATELDPDDFIAGGDFQVDAWDKPAPAPVLGLPTADESHRVKTSTAGEAHIDKRFEYRYVAADLAWSAAALMPDESDQTAAVLNEAGGWLKTRDPKAAAKFYKALVSRCGSIKLGQQAKHAHWFPTTTP